jgi:hypothetical protein
MKKKPFYYEYLESVPVNIEAVIRAHDVELDKNADLKNDVSGQIELVSDGSYKISIQKTDHYYRKRFTMAHELGHFILHRDKIRDGLDDNKMYRTMYRGNNRVSETEETEANIYAAGVLMPEDLVVQYAKDRGVFVGNDNERKAAMQEMATAFQVSEVAMRIRIDGLRDKILTN